MRYYTKRPKYYRSGSIKKIKFPYTLVVLIMLIILFNYTLFLFNKRIFPCILKIGEIQMKSEAVKVINEESVKIYSESFKYDDIIDIDKDDEGNIIMIRADTVKQNYLASQVVLSCDKRLEEIGDLGIKVPLGYLTNNIAFYNMGPNITVKMKQIGNINTEYESVFESAGINQTRHKIYLKVTTTLRVVVPFNSRDIKVSSEIPVSDTIIVGKIPETAINMNN